MATGTHTFGKDERICSKLQVDSLFGKGGSRSLSAFPLRVVYRLYPQPETAKTRVQVLVSVPKRHLKRAVARNRVKRQVREAYRLGKETLLAGLPEGQHLDVAFIWLSDELADTAIVKKRVANLLARMAERLTHNKPQP